MRKSFLLLPLMLALLCGCGGEENGPESTQIPTQAVTQTPASDTVATAPPAPTEAPAATATPVPTETPTAVPTAEPTPTATPIPAPIEGYTEKESEAIRSVLKQRIVYENSYNNVSIWLDSTYWQTGTSFGSLSLPKNSAFQSLDVENDVKALKMDGKNWLAVTAKANILTDGVVSTYEDDVLELMIPVTREADGKITLGEYQTKKYQRAENSDHYAENNYIRTQLHIMQVDVTHDGIDDYIETYVYFPPNTDFTTDIDELVQMRMIVDEIRVSVYDGSTANEQDLGTPIWSNGYSSAHAGNGQLSIVRKDGLSYLLCTSLWEGQGSTNYSFDVIALDKEGRQYIIDQYSVDYDERYLTEDTTWEDKKQYIASFKELLVPWLEDGQLVVSADFVLDPLDQMLATERKQFTPQDFYDIVWKKWGL